LFVPASLPPHKEGATAAPFEDRYRMVELACKGEPHFEASRIEAGQISSYSIRTIERLRAERPGDILFFLIGADAFAEIKTWHRWREVAQAVEFIVASRPGYAYEIPEHARVHRLDTLQVPVSSSDIRRQLAAGLTPVGLPPDVLKYIRVHGLYRQSDVRNHVNFHQ
jgi:nicotinate-nucleotide adenylyltransferase